MHDYSRESIQMSSVRFYVLAALVEGGPMHGHALRALAEQEHVHEWTDISVGSLYGAMKRLAAEGLIAEVRTEREGNYPERQVYAITDAGRAALTSLQRATLADLSWRHDPVDLALARLDPDTLDDLEAVLRARRDALAARLAEHERNAVRIRQYLTLAETFSTGHGTHRLRAEVAWHDELLAALPDIVADERSRKEPS
jgi:DNA-binding PadR family transcriptional regulator